MPGVEPNRDLITYCGLYCGDCPAHKGRIADRACELREELEAEEYARAADFFASGLQMSVYGKYGDFTEVLGMLENSRCAAVCRSRDDQNCEIAPCCREKEYEGCWECGEFEDCGKLRHEFFEKLHLDGHIENLREMRENGVEGFLAGKRLWMGKMK